MKKVIGIFGTAVCAMALFANTSTNSNGDVNLDNLLSMNTANAESSCCIGSKFKVTSIPGGWHCQNDAGSSCCPIC